MKLKEFIPQLKNAVQEGAEKALSHCVIGEGICSKAEAYRLFGRTDVERWIAEGLLTPIAKNGKVSKMIDRTQLERVAAASNRISYLTVAER
jgi:hypothetical protein